MTDDAARRPGAGASRPHRFPPLSQLGSGGLTVAHAGASAADVQAALARGYDKGQELGWNEGYESGRQQGHADGYQAGSAEAQAQAETQIHQRSQTQMDALAAPVDAVFKALQQAHDEFQVAQRKELVDLVARVARQVIRCELALQPVQLLSLVDETLATMPPPHQAVEVFLNPEDLRRIHEVDPVRAQRWSLVADSQLDAGECRVKSGRREADAGCHQRLAAVMEQVGAQLLDPSDTAEAFTERPHVPAQPRHQVLTTTADDVSVSHQNPVASDESAVDATDPKPATPRKPRAKTLPRVRPESAQAAAAAPATETTNVTKPAPRKTTARKAAVRQEVPA